ncbi:SGNH/GDSL hydrolase family protein [Arthrobacter sp. CDRTa11]|uniref:SGNH/GDSL hydrolase family protein n=1 Tax=Arthrobacter sp. CDRTa11 TaxID=2651199 RepID=UPI0022658584|nr:SGNH/GDSL hydrolase family protein [Arthrobacter sp. CDRTa11]UZX03997.1 SGNH/GDSL hydrolase family protein [Arthrobacter sp. CDRTa11]
MRKASAIARFVASGIAACALLSGCGQPLEPLAAGGPLASGPPASGIAVSGSSTEMHGPGQGKYAAPGAGTAKLQAGSVYRNPESGRDEVVVPDIGNTALLIGDSQSEPADGWPRLGLAAVGYKVHFCGLGGTGFATSNGKTGNYVEALLRGDWKLPYGSPPLIILQGGGNDAARGATDAQIVAHTDRLIAVLRERYPDARMAMIGTLARDAHDGGGRRHEVDALLGTVAARHGMPFVGVGDWLTKYGLAKDLADAVHMNAAGRKSLGALLEARLRELRLDAQLNGKTGSLLAGAPESSWTE